MKKSLIMVAAISSLMMLGSCTNTPTTSTSPATSTSTSVSTSDSESTAPSTDTSVTPSVTPSTEPSVEPSTEPSVEPSTEVSDSEETSDSTAPIEATAITLNEQAKTLKVGGTFTLTYAVTPTEAVIGQASWSSSDASVATVTEDGLVTAIKAGTCNIILTVADSTLTITPCAITVEADDPEVKIAATLSLYKDPGQVEEAITSVTESSGAYPLFVALSDLPSGKTMEDYTYEWPVSNPQYAIGEYAPDAKDYKRFFTPVCAGVFDISVNVKEGDTVVAVAKLSVTVKADYSKYTVISTPEDFTSKVMTSTNGADKFALGANIDLGGKDTDGAKNGVTFNGILDGRGYTVRNFNANPLADNTNGGIWFNISAAAVVKNTHFIGTLNQSAGFGGLLCREMMGTVQDCVFDATSTVDTSGAFNWTWCRSGIVAGLLKGTIKDCVVNNVTNNAQMLDTTAYAGIAADGPVAIDNIYTSNSATETNQHVLPFDPDPGQSWCSTANTSNIHDSQVYADNQAENYDLTSEFWQLTDGVMPGMIHDNDEFACYDPEITAETSAKILSLSGANATVTLSNKNFDGEVTYSATSSVDGIVALTNNNDGTFTVAPVSEGSVDVTFKGVSGTQEATAVVSFKVQESAAPAYDIPENAIEIKDKDSLFSFFNGSAEHTHDNAYLSSDIDLGGAVIDGVKMADQYYGIFEGQGHSISNYTQSGGTFFNMVAATGIVRNVKVICGGYATSGFGPFVYCNNGGTISNVDVEVTLTASINSWGPIAFFSTGTIVDCDSTIHMTAAAASSNTLFHIARNDAGSSFVNCTYLVDGEGAAATAFAADPAGVTAR